MSKKGKKSKMVQESAVVADDPNQPAESAPQSGGVEQDCNQDGVAALAYKMWQERGCPIGSDQEDWFRAESELKNAKTVAAAGS